MMPLMSVLSIYRTGPPDMPTLQNNPFPFTVLLSQVQLHSKGVGEHARIWICVRAQSLHDNNRVHAHARACNCGLSWQEIGIPRKRETLWL